jgi:hypothetical protein
MKTQISLTNIGRRAAIVRYTVIGKNQSQRTQIIFESDYFGILARLRNFDLQSARRGSKLFGFCGPFAD